mgnify:CR=1 FL=1
MLDKILKRGGAISLSVDAARTYVLKFLKIVLDPRARAWYNRGMKETTFITVAHVGLTLLGIFLFVGAVAVSTGLMVS